jgi:hypothetical protein
MSVSFLKKSGLDAESGTLALAGMRLLMSSKFLYRRLGSAATVILTLFIVIVTLPWSAAQGRPQLKRPEDVPQEKPAESKKTKKEKGPRAVGLLQLSNGKATLVPIAILIDGKFFDASVYKSDPVPMALEGGTVYEVEQTGESQGLFTIKGALHNKNPGNSSPWLGTGSYVLNGAEVAKTTHKAEDMPVGMDGSSNDAPPRLTRGKESNSAAPSNPSSGSSSGNASPAGASEKPGTTTPGASSQPTGGSSADGSSGRDAQTPAAAPAPAGDQGSKKQAAPGQTSPSEASPSKSSSSQSAQDPKSQGSSAQSNPQGQETGNYYRPTLRRGKPTETAPPDEEESAPKVDKPGSPAAASDATQIPVQLVPAISDAGGPDAQSYKCFWKEGEEDERRTQMLALAAEEVRAYVSAREKGTIPAKPSVAKAGGTKAVATTHKPALKPVQPVFENVQFHGFDVWKNNQVVMIFSAEAHLPPAPGVVASPTLYSVSIAARTDIYGNLRKLYSGVTDKFHLDVTPRLDLIDVVDADGDGRGELLFRETTDAGTGYVIYRATADKLWKMFDSLSEE